MPAPANARTKQYKRTNLIRESQVMIPTRVLVQYRFANYTVDANCPAPVIKVWGIKRNDSVTKVNPQYLTDTTNGIALLDSGTIALATQCKETAQVIELNSEYLITGAVAEIVGIEYLARVRKVSLFAKADRYADEQEFILT